MLSKESVKRRLEERENGLSYTEFSYMLLQSYDFLYLHDNYNCKIQAGGNDQWGNITAGIDMIRKLRQKEAYGITFPLLTTSSGEKFGKSAGNAIWLDEKLTTPYQFYQYWYNTEDRDVERLYKLFTDMNLAEIDTIISKHHQNPELRIAQKKLAEIITLRVHGNHGLNMAARVSDILFGKVVTDICENDLSSIANDIPFFELSLGKNKTQHSLIDFLVSSKICSSRGESRKLIQGGGVYINNVKILDCNYHLTTNDLIANIYSILRIGKKQFYLIKLI
jgi:tyrosyl-tRNA synthetase